MLINILIRTGNRPELFRRCLASIKRQSHREVRVIVCYDRAESLAYIPDWVEKVQVIPDKSKPFFWNLYCNSLKALVVDGWFFFLDDDDYIINDFALANIAKHLADPSRGVICQFQRWGQPKPSHSGILRKEIIRGRIGMPCIFLHHTKKDLATFDGFPAADFRFIKDVAKVLPMNFVRAIVVKTDRISAGK